MQTPYTQKLSRQKKYTKTFTHRCFAQRCFCTHKCRIIKAHRRFYTESFTRRTFTQRNLYTEKNDTEKLVHTDCAKKQLHTETFACKNITQSNFFTFFFRTETFPHRNLFCTETFMYSGFYTDAFTHKHINSAHTKTCAHSTFLHTANFYTERLCFPFLITYVSCSPLHLSSMLIHTKQHSNIVRICSTIITVQKIGHCIFEGCTVLKNILPLKCCRLRTTRLHVLQKYM
jgi:hypothetical protein